MTFFDKTFCQWIYSFFLSYLIFKCVTGDAAADKTVTWKPFDYHSTNVWFFAAWLAQVYQFDIVFVCFFTVKWCGRTSCFHYQCQMTENNRCNCKCKCNAFCACVHTLESRKVSVTMRKCSTLFQFQTLVLTIVTTVQIDLTSQTNTKATQEAKENMVDKHAGILKCSWISLARSLTHWLRQVSSLRTYFENIKI